jgi:hypothetical protein
MADRFDQFPTVTRQLWRRGAAAPPSIHELSDDWLAWAVTHRGAAAGLEDLPSSGDGTEQYVVNNTPAAHHAAFHRLRNTF